MRIAVISDIHGNLAALEAVLADVRRRGVDATVALGDYLSGPFDPLGVADLIMASGFCCVRGNHDRWLVEGRGQDRDWPVDAAVRGLLAGRHGQWLSSIPGTDVFAGDVFMCHATPQDDVSFWMDKLTESHGVVSMSRDHIEAIGEGIPQPVLVCGHTHVPRTLRLADGRLLLNPGSVGLPFLLGSPDARYAIIERRSGHWAAELLVVPYDRRPAMAQAEKLGFPGFARALETGWARLEEL
jgi:predicted phosphodiesterase